MWDPHLNRNRGPLTDSTNRGNARSGQTAKLWTLQSLWLALATLYSASQWPRKSRPQYTSCIAHKRFYFYWPAPCTRIASTEVLIRNSILPNASLMMFILHKRVDTVTFAAHHHGGPIKSCYVPAPLYVTAGVSESLLAFKICDSIRAILQVSITITYLYCAPWRG